MKASSRVAAPRALTSSAGFPVARTRPESISDIRSQRSASFMKWVDTKIVTPWLRERSISASQKRSRASGIDTRGRLIQDEYFGLMDDGDGQREPLANSQWQIQRALIEIVLKAELSDQLGNTQRRLFRRQMKNARVKIEVLPDRKFGIEGERLRHVADAIARTDVAGVEGLSEQQRLAGRRRQQACQHFHGRGLAAAVRAEKAEDLAAFDREIHPVDGGEIAEAAGQVAGRDNRLVVENPKRRYLERVASRCAAAPEAAQ